MNMRSHQEVFPSSKRPRLENAMENSNTCEKELKDSRLKLSKMDNDCVTISRDISSTEDLPDVKPEIALDFSNFTGGYDANSFENPHQESIFAQDYLNTFFKDLNFENLDCSTPLTSLKDEPFQEPTNNILQTTVKHEMNELQANSLSQASGEIQSIATPTFATKSDKLYNSNVFHKELSDCFYLTLKLKNKQYSIHIREFKRNVSTNEEIPTKNGVNMDIHSWYEFQYKILAFNLRYKSASFVSNNTILVLNQDSMMRIKNLKNFSHVDLNEQQMEKLKESTSHLNTVLLQHMYTKLLPFLIKQKCVVSNRSTEKEPVLWSKLNTCIENNMITILNQLYECTGCIFRHASQSLHSCFAFNNKEKFNQLGEALLMLIDFDYVISTFLNGVYSVSEHFLHKLHEQTVYNELFKTK